MQFPGRVSEARSSPQPWSGVRSSISSDPPLQVVDRNLARAWLVGISRPLRRVSRQTSSVAVFASMLDGPPGAAGPAERISMTSLSFGCDRAWSPPGLEGPDGPSVAPAVNGTSPSGAPRNPRSRAGYGDRGASGRASGRPAGRGWHRRPSGPPAPRCSRE